MLQLYKSNHFALTEVRTSGKKEVRGVLCFEGLPSVYGSSTEVLALEEGVVMMAGRCHDPRSRDYRRGTIVTVTGQNGVCITYGRLDHRFVNEGDFVHAGQPIGVQGSTGSGMGEYLTLEFRRNGRRVDGCEYLGIPPKPMEFCPPDCRVSDVVARACGLTDHMRVYMDCYADADELWSRIYRHLSTR
ncbi:MAG: M23 family metallopeptidase [Ruminococcaceae bacterium]|nr:M23 family metallopeptidase [Oscillospiraceae bacterium]